ncbi:28S ribosomal protein S14, mitochondrial [Coccinella septempunctata]|uniref:28S ribosomal protein S14, mitochondrial n=1 Tax=Coccinella septempunctata TaxID=41139 RepID=UPI001D0912A6|nr:28S ribosomal protein S14, mitochondrial [Coccinella septempunctata]
MNIYSSITSKYTRIFHTNVNPLFQQVRNKWVNRWMIRDVKRRKMTTEYAPMRLRVNALRKNDILPPEIRELADAEIHSYPKDSTLLRCAKRCVITSRPRGVVHRWRLSRIVFRHLADYNKLSGIQRAMW